MQLWMNFRKLTNWDLSGNVTYRVVVGATCGLPRANAVRPYGIVL